MRLLVTGGTGLIGSALIKSLKQEHSVVALSRRPEVAQKQLGVTAISDLSSLSNLNGFDGIINLAGEPIADKRWSSRQKLKIQQSRFNLTQQLATLINKSDKVKVLISASAIGYYGRQGSEPINESEQNCYPEFSHSLCAQWEALAQQANCRVCTTRIGIVLAEKGGALKKMLPPFKLGLGGPVASGEQYMSWIHIDDIVSAIEFLLNSPDASGPFNLTAPQPVSNQIFSRALASRLYRPCLFRVPQVSLRLMFGEMADLLIFGQNVVPKRLEEQGFHFQYRNIDEALAALQL